MFFFYHMANMCAIAKGHLEYFSVINHYKSLVMTEYIIALLRLIDKTVILQKTTDSCQISGFRIQS